MLASLSFGGPDDVPDDPRNLLPQIIRIVPNMSNAFSDFLSERLTYPTLKVRLPLCLTLGPLRAILHAMADRNEPSRDEGKKPKHRPRGLTFPDLIARYNRALFVDHLFPTICAVMALFCGWLARGVNRPDSHYWLLVAMTAFGILAVLVLYIQRWRSARKAPKQKRLERAFLVYRFSDSWGQWVTALRLYGKFRCNGDVYRRCGPTTTKLAHTLTLTSGVYQSDD